MNTANKSISFILPKTRIWLHFCHWQYRSIAFAFMYLCPKTTWTNQSRKTNFSTKMAS